MATNMFAEFNSSSDTIVGIDEVGRGCAAGPVVSCAVYWSPVLAETYGYGKFSNDLRDSKQLSSKKRFSIYEKIINTPTLFYAIGSSSVEEINRIGICPATFLSMERAFIDLMRYMQATFPPKISDIDYIVIDGNQSIPSLKEWPQKAIVKADTYVPAVMCASIIAKVWRDADMKTLAASYPEYQWDKNFGYCTAAHSEAILQYGITAEHRLWPKYYQRIGINLQSIKTYTSKHKG